MLDAITDIDRTIVATLRHGDRAWPSERLEHIDCVANSSLASLVLRGVSADLGNPGCTLATYDRRVFIDSEESLGRLVGFIELFEVAFTIIISDVRRNQVGATTSLEDVLGQVTPVLEGLERLDAAVGLLFGHLEVLRLLVDLKDALRHDLGGVLDTGQLCTQQVLLRARVRRV